MILNSTHLIQMSLLRWRGGGYVKCARESQNKKLTLPCLNNLHDHLKARRKCQSVEARHTLLLDCAKTCLLWAIFEPQEMKSYNEFFHCG